jgi:creatinine amidohydrolase
MPDRLRRTSDLSWSEYRERAIDSVVLLPAGAHEQHGLHLPLDTDAFIAEALAARVAEAIDGLVLPCLAYGARSLARSGGGDGFPGTTNLDGGTLVALVRDVLREQYRHGVRRAVVLLGHGENDPFAIEGANLAAREVRDPAFRVLVIGWWHVVPDDMLASLFPEGFPGWDLEHAGRVETALMFALAPERVRRERIGSVDPVVAPAFTEVPARSGRVPSQGSLADPRGATADGGAQLVKAIVAGLVAAIEASFGPRGAARP